MRTSREWREYYEQNAASLLDIPWNVGGDLTQVERQAIASSLQGFQAGERSEGRHLYRCAEKYAEESGDHEYVGADCLVVWFFHGKVIRKSELRFGQFWHGCWAEFNRAFGHSKAVAAYLSSENRTVVEDTAA